MEDVTSFLLDNGSFRGVKLGDDVNNIRADEVFEYSSLNSKETPSYRLFGIWFNNKTKIQVYTEPDSSIIHTIEYKLALFPEDEKCMIKLSGKRYVLNHLGMSKILKAFDENKLSWRFAKCWGPVVYIYVLNTEWVFEFDEGKMRLSVISSRVHL